MNKEQEEPGIPGALISDNASLYINFPFCRSRCPFCHYIDNLSFSFFNIPDAYIDKLLRQMEKSIAAYRNPFRWRTCSLGGGTPSLLSAKQFSRLAAWFQRHGLRFEEFSLEVLPDTWDMRWLDDGMITRLSFGLQSIDADWLKRNGRKPGDIERVRNAVMEVQKSNHPCKCNIDLIFDDKFPVAAARSVMAWQPDSITVYPKTANRTFAEVKALYRQLGELDFSDCGYTRVSPNSFIFLRDSSAGSLYVENEFVRLNDVVGIGHNSVSSVGEQCYLSLFQGSTWRYILKTEHRYWEKLLWAIPFGVTDSLLRITAIGIIDFLRPGCVPGLYYLPYENIETFHDYLIGKCPAQLESVFFRALFFGARRPGDFPPH